ncbi:high mobility group B protein 10-like [Senna tora]|uniref:High mobility group B protein 10-like n=1 Tax=Senna tora TaxID=362788 RepID=A0A834T453_9FABA|nr:high mobility group B protein 10-like [Senna tora]
MSNPKRQREYDSPFGYTVSVSAASDGQSSIGTTKSYPPPNALYEDLAQRSDLFWENLQHFHNSLGSKFKVPTIGGKPLDLYHLFMEVTSRGGLEKVIGDRKWKEVITVFKFPDTITSASFVLRKYYQSLLYDFEQVYYFRKRAPSFSILDPVNNSLKEGTSVNDLPGQNDVAMISDGSRIYSNLNASPNHLEDRGMKVFMSVKQINSLHNDHVMLHNCKENLLNSDALSGALHRFPNTNDC